MIKFWLTTLIQWLPKVSRFVKIHRGFGEKLSTSVNQRYEVNIYRFWFRRQCSRWNTVLSSALLHSLYNLKSFGINQLHFSDSFWILSFQWLRILQLSSHYCCILFVFVFVFGMNIFFRFYLLLLLNIVVDPVILYKSQKFQCYSMQINAMSRRIFNIYTQALTFTHP